MFDKQGLEQEAGERPTWFAGQVACRAMAATVLTAAGFALAGGAVAGRSKTTALEAVPRITRR